MPAVHVGAPLRAFWRIHPAFMRLSGGRFGRVGAMDALLLTTTGRKSGGRRDVALNYVRDGGSYVVVASYAGEDRDPAWWKNLKAHPDAEIAVGGTRIKVRAHESEGATRRLLWERIVERDASYDAYQRRTKRRIPIVVLEPVG